MAAMLPCLNSAPSPPPRKLSFLDALREAASIRGAEPPPWVLSATPVVFPTPTPSRPLFPSPSPSPSVGVAGDPWAQGWSSSPSAFERERGPTTPSATPWEAQVQCKQEPGGRQEYPAYPGHPTPCTPADGAVFQGLSSPSVGAEECGVDCSLSLGLRKRRHPGEGQVWGVPTGATDIGAKRGSTDAAAPTWASDAGAQTVGNTWGMEKQLPELHQEHSLQQEQEQQWQQQRQEQRQQEQQWRRKVQNVKREVQAEQQEQEPQPQQHQQQRQEHQRQEQQEQEHWQKEQQLLLPGPLGLLLQIVHPQTGWQLSEWADGEEGSVGPTSAFASPASSSCSRSASPLPRSKRAKVKEERTEDL